MRKWRFLLGLVLVAGVTCQGDQPAPTDEQAPSDPQGDEQAPYDLQGDEQAPPEGSDHPEAVQGEGHPHHPQTQDSHQTQESLVLGGEGHCPAEDQVRSTTYNILFYQ